MTLNSIPFFSSPIGAYRNASNLRSKRNIESDCVILFGLDSMAQKTEGRTREAPASPPTSCPSNIVAPGERRLQIGRDSICGADHGVWRGFIFGACPLKAASTSSSFMRLSGSPNSPRFCSSVPSPIIPRWIIRRGCLGGRWLGLVAHQKLLCAGGLGSRSPAV
jgi:hypothetical protein